MRFASLLGWFLMVAAFIAAAAETVVHTVPGVGGLVISAYDLWYTISPKSLVIARIIVERDVHAIIWDPLLVTVLQFPAWLLIGGPGAALAWFFRPPRPESESIEDDSIFVYDRLVEAAKKETGLEEPPLEYPYDLPPIPLEEDSLEDDFDPSGSPHAPDDGPYDLPPIPLKEDSREDDLEPSGSPHAPDDGPNEPGGDEDGRA